MTTDDIPITVQIQEGTDMGAYTSTKDPRASTWSWYKDSDIHKALKHITVGTRDDERANKVVYTGSDETSPDPTLWTYTHTIVKEKTWTGLHLSIPIGGFNLHRFYKIDQNWKVKYSGDNSHQIPQREQNIIKQQKTRTAINAWDTFVQAFVTAARIQALFGMNKLKPVPKVGPQQPQSFDDGEGL